METMNTFQDTLGCRDGPHDSLRRNEWSIKFQLEDGGKPSTWFPPGELVELSKD